MSNRHVQCLYRIGNSYPIGMPYIFALLPLGNAAPQNVVNGGQFRNEYTSALVATVGSTEMTVR